MYTPNNGELAMLKNTLTYENLNLRLYINKKTPGNADLYSDYTQPSGGGYANKTLTVSGSNNTFTFTGTIVSGENVLTSVSSVTGLYIGQRLTTSANSPIPADTFITGLTDTTVTLSNNAVAGGTGVTVTAYKWTVKITENKAQALYAKQVFTFTGTITSPSNKSGCTLNADPANVIDVPNTTDLVVGQAVANTGSEVGIPSGTYITAIDSVNNKITISNNATSTGSRTLQFTNQIWGAILVSDSPPYTLYRVITALEGMTIVGSGDHYDISLNITLESVAS